MNGLGQTEQAAAGLTFQVAWASEEGSDRFAVSKGLPP